MPLTINVVDSWKELVFSILEFLSFRDGFPRDKQLYKFNLEGKGEESEIKNTDGETKYVVL